MGQEVGRGGGRSLDQRASSVKQDAWQPHLAMVADGLADIKTRKRTEGAATGVQAVQGDCCSAKRIDLDPICSTSFGYGCAKPPALPRSREDVLVDNCAAATKSCLNPWR